MAGGSVDMSCLIQETQDRYQFTRIIGRGAYGVVLAATEKATGRTVAIKRVERFLETSLDAKRTLREIRCLSQLRHENITNLIEISASHSFDSFDAIVIVMDLMDTDLYQIINSGQSLLMEHHRYFIYQLLRGLKYIHSANVLHRDLKPGNLLLNANCDLKITDFGLARQCDEGPDALSEYVATRWYRAPEVLLSYDTYGPAMDMWSVGCIVAELIVRKPLFPGTNTLDQIRLVNERIGSPTRDDLQDCVNHNALEFVAGLPNVPDVDFGQLLAGGDPDEIDLVAGMLKWNPNDRLTVDEALAHPFMTSLHDPVDEPVTEPLYEFEFERPDITMEELKVALWMEVLKFHPEFAQ